MAVKITFDVIIIGGSYSGLAAGMALGRAMRSVLIIDDAKPCNRQTPHSHNFLTNDGKAPAEITASASLQVSRYETINFLKDYAVAGKKTETGFEIQVKTGETFRAKKLIFATGIIDVLPPIPGFAECWGISVLHCPYCHGYEIRNQKTGIFSNGDTAFDFAKLISNWTNDLTLFTNGPPNLSTEQYAKLESHNIKIVEKEIEKLEHVGRYLRDIVFKDRTKTSLIALYAPVPFKQHSNIPELLGCQLTEEGYIEIDALQETTAKGIFACGDNAIRMRTVANAVATGTTAGMTVSKQMILEEF